MNAADIKNIVSVVREVVRGYYVIIFRSTDSYKVCKLHKEEFTHIFEEGDWVVETRDELTRFLLTSSTDSTTSASEFLTTFCSYTDGKQTKIAQQTIVCDWSVYELVFGTESPDLWLKSVHSEKI